MIRFDETLLSAYLDGELDPDQRHGVEAALRDRPELADRLHALTEVRGLVADLPRPRLAVDLAPAVLARIGLHRGSTSVRLGPWSLTRGQRRLGLGAAALLMLTVILGLLAKLPSLRPDRPTHPQVAGATRHVLPASPRSTPGPSGAPDVMPADEARAAQPASIAAQGQGTAHNLAEDDPERDRKRIQALLDSRSLSKIFIVTDTIGGLATARVDKLIQETPRTESAYGRITVTQGIIIDPRHPSEATVFALVMDDRELEQFQTKLNRAFPDTIEETRADPTLVTKLSHIGQIAVQPGTTSVDRDMDLPFETSSRVASHDEETHPPVALADRALELGPAQRPTTTRNDEIGPRGSTGPARAQNPPIATAPISAAQPSRTGALGTEDNRALRSLDKSLHLRAPQHPTSLVLVWITAHGSGGP